MKHTINLQNSLLKEKAIQTNLAYYTEINILFEYLMYNTCTASMISEVTGIKQKNICRYKRYLEKKGLLKEVYRTYCKTTGFKAWYLSTNPELVSFNRQTRLKLIFG